MKKKMSKNEQIDYGKCIENGHQYKYISHNKSTYGDGKVWVSLIYECKVCGYTMERNSTRRELRAAKTLGLI